jgi:arginyl-tRNA synthetase
LLGIIKDDEVVHAKFGLLLNEQGKKFSTRGGNIVYLEHLINEVINLAYNLISKKNPNLTEKEKRKIAKIVGIGAIKYNDLSRDRQSDIVFNKTKMLSLEGNSCSYLQYTIVRINSIFKKAGKVKLTKNVFSDKLERDLAVLILKFPEIILEASQKLKPNILADYLYNIASTFHRFYEVLPVLSASKQQKSLRLILIKTLAKVVNQGLNILGIKSPSKM